MQVHKIQWLSKSDNGEIHGSMVLYLARSESHEKLLRDIQVEGDSEKAFTGLYERRRDPMRCFSCHQIYRVAAQCSSTIKMSSMC